MTITLDGTIGITTPSITTAAQYTGDFSVADKILHLGDLDTAIRFPAADTITMETNGLERMRIDSAGNVGIGTTTPVADLDVVGYAATTRGIAMGTANVDATAYLSQYRSTVETIWGPLTTRAILGTLSNHDVAFQTNSLERMRIDSSGNVGIGTISPATALHVSGIGIFENTSPSLTFAETDTTDQDHRIRVNGGALLFETVSDARVQIREDMRIESTGIVTITNLAGTGSRAVNASATGVLSAASDSRLKQEVKTAPIPGLAEIMLLEPKAYQWLDDIEKRGEGAAVEIGFFADQVKDIIPSAAPMGNDGYYGFYDRSVVAALTKAIQEQQATIQALTARIATLEAK